MKTTKSQMLNTLSFTVILIEVQDQRFLFLIMCIGYFECCTSYRQPSKLWKGNVFSHVCLSVGLGMEWGGRSNLFNLDLTAHREHYDTSNWNHNVYHATINRMIRRYDGTFCQPILVPLLLFHQIFFYYSGKTGMIKRKWKRNKKLLSASTIYL